MSSSWHTCVTSSVKTHKTSTNPSAVQNLEPVLRACPELQKLNLASCALLGENALDALLPAGARGSPSPSFTQVLPTYKATPFLCMIMARGCIQSVTCLHVRPCICLTREPYQVKPNGRRGWLTRHCLDAGVEGQRAGCQLLQSAHQHHHQPSHPSHHPRGEDACAGRPRLSCTAFEAKATFL